MIQLIQLFLVALTVRMEAGGEPYVGKLAVAWVIQNRRTTYSRSLMDVIFDPYDFSCWNTDSITRMNLDKTTDAELIECLHAAEAACFGLEGDPTKGAVFYMNVDVVKNSNGGKLPDWWTTDGDFNSEVKIGHHTFRRKK